MSSEKAILAGGCFWGMEELFRNLRGVQSTRVGYTGGDFENPTYKDITTGETNHAEAIEIVFNTLQINYRQLLEFFFQIHDPTTKDRQGNDRGAQYRSAIFVLDEVQEKTAEEVIANVNASGKWPAKVVTQIVEAGIFYEAEVYHQKYLKIQPDGYTCHFIRPNWKL